MGKLLKIFLQRGVLVSLPQRQGGGGQKAHPGDQGTPIARHYKHETSTVVKRKGTPNYWHSKLLASPQETPKKTKCSRLLSPAVSDEGPAHMGLGEQ